MLDASNIHKNYGPLHVLKGVNIHIDKGEIVSIVGSSGAGKSTLLHILGTLDKADKGEISLNSERVDICYNNCLAYDLRSQPDVLLLRVSGFVSLQIELTRNSETASLVMGAHVANQP